ncbi:MAG: ICEBs1 excisionase [Clostridia bacterium]|nr:hypothetical protein [Schwartzia sp. (in: firmicutes)]MBR4979534.1 ICEBs1 excisionase [Clostridia bacterium]MBR5162986.1 hypothetical protein [Schwartzia sp. (in: firmicutes)]
MRDANETEKSRKYYATVKDVQEIIGCGRTTATDIIRKMNKELEKQGKWTVAGKIPWAYLKDRLGIELEATEMEAV